MKSIVVWCFAMLLFAHNSKGASLSNADQQAATAVAWSDVTRTEVCTPTRNAPMCIHGIFAVLSSGIFVFLSSEYEDVVGMIKDEDLKKVELAVQAVDRSTFRNEIECEPAMGIPEVKENKLTLTYQDQDPLVIREQNNQGMCYRSTQPGATDALDLLMKNLTATYAGDWRAGTKRFNVERPQQGKQAAQL